MMHRAHAVCPMLLILSMLLTGCSLSLTVPSPDTLMAVFAAPFVCAFSYYDADTDASPMEASLVRTPGEERLTVYGDTVDTVFVRTANDSLLTRGTAEHPPLSLPLPDGWDFGGSVCFALFSVLADEGFQSVRAEDGIVVTNADGSFSAVFSEDGTPQRISLGSRTAVITSFSRELPSP